MENFDLKEFGEFIHQQMLIEKADRLLKKNGFDPNGNKIKAMVFKQYRFDHSIIKNSIRV